MANRLKIPTYNMEAGNRCFDANVPEETNRRLVDHTADFNLAHTEHARRSLLSEGLEPRRVVVTGSPMCEVLDICRHQIEASNTLGVIGVEAGQYFLVSAHHEENVDNSERLAQLVRFSNAVAQKWEKPILVTTHPHTRKRLDAQSNVVIDDRVRFHPPFGFLGYCKLQLGAIYVLSDSGTIALESTILGFPAVTLRGAIERTEALDTGASVIVMSILVRC